MRRGAGCRCLYSCHLCAPDLFNQAAFEVTHVLDDSEYRNVGVQGRGSLFLALIARISTSRRACTVESAGPFAVGAKSASLGKPAKRRRSPGRNGVRFIVVTMSIACWSLDHLPLRTQGSLDPLYPPRKLPATSTRSCKSWSRTKPGSRVRFVGPCRRRSTLGRRTRLRIVARLQYPVASEFPVPPDTHFRI